MYAENRILPHVPWKPQETYQSKQAPPTPKVEEPQEEVKPKIMKKTPVKGWSQKEESKSGNEVTNEFNVLAGLIVDCANDVEQDNFKLNMFNKNAPKPGFSVT